MTEINESAGQPDWAADMISWRHDFHQHPELGFEEQRTAARIAELLGQFGIAVHEGVGGTGVVGVLKCGSARAAIGLRADMDALTISEANDFAHRSRNDGKMHACGHDGHTAMLLGAAKHLARSRDFDGTAVFIFQPAEEHGRGALAMIEDGLFTRFPVDAVYGIHNMPSLAAGHFAVRSGPIMACEDNFEITVQGKGGHAAMPHLTIDPIVVASEIVLALQSVVSRSLNPVDCGVLSVTDFAVDATRNAIPEKVVLRGDTRAFTPAIGQQIETAMERLVAGICAAHGAAHSFTYSREFAATINSAREVAIAADVARAAFGADNVDADCQPIMASEDFGFMLQHKAGCYLLLGNGGDGPGGCGLHSPHYDFNDDILTTGATFWVRLVQAQLPAQAATEAR
ncbi:MAG: amidohydrolase [Rhodospirillales bacterium]|nr:amidohydrolase [Rhodospirillales bacterium]